MTTRNIVNKKNYKCMENKQALPALGFGEALKSTWQNITNLNGRARRSELWWSFLVYVAATVISALIMPDAYVLTAISLALYVWIAAVTVRRLHDHGHSGWWVAAAVAFSVVQNVYATASGMTEILQAANVSPDDIIEVFSSPVYLVCSIGGMVCNIAILIFCLQDSTPAENKYGLSPKYITEG